MCIHETEHYVFHVKQGSPAQRDIEQIACHQEGCFAHVTNCLGLVPKEKIHYFFYDSPENLGRELEVRFGEYIPMNGCTVSEFEILAVYNDMDRCIGFHEDTHIISYQLCSPQSEFLLEGLACCMEQLWWGIDNLAWTAYYFKNALLPPVADMFDNEAFASVDCFISYPAAGAFVQYLMLRFGMERFLRFYSAVDESCTDGAEHIFGYPLKVLEHDFCQYLELMWYDEAVTARIRQLLSSCGIE